MSQSSYIRNLRICCLCIVFLLIAGFSPLQAAPADIVGGTRAFNNHFNVDRIGYDPANAYLLLYMVTAVYPDNLARIQFPLNPRADARTRAITFAKRKSVTEMWHKNFPNFVSSYGSATKHLFAGMNPKYYPISRCIGGYDPEVVLIDTTKALFVVFRGTDRVACGGKSGPGYDTFEWIYTDFDFMPTQPYENIFSRTGQQTGSHTLSAFANNNNAQVHKGFWDSLVLAIDPPANLYTQVRQLSNNGRKKIWVTGHSLGAGQAQTFSLFLTAKGLRPQGVYAFAAPHVANPTVVAWMNRHVGKSTLQRFDFVNDPVTILPPYEFPAVNTPGRTIPHVLYGRAGTRNYYDDVRTFEHGKRERLAVEDQVAKYYSIVGTIAAGHMVAKVNVGAQIMEKGQIILPFCFHHPQWYLQAAYWQVSGRLRSQMPNLAALEYVDETWDGCNAATVARAKNRGLVGEAMAATENVIQDVKYNVNQLFANASGTAVSESNYYIRTYKTKKYLRVDPRCRNTNGCRLILGDRSRADKFRVKKALGGYQIEFTVGRNNFKRVELKGEELSKNGGRVQGWSRALGPNQTWLFYRTGSGPQTAFVIKNAAGSINNKVMSAHGCANQNGCQVQTFGGVSNNQDQLWVLHK